MREVLSPLAARLVLLRPKGLPSCFGRPRACSELALIGISKGGRGMECVGGGVHRFLDHANCRLRHRQYYFRHFQRLLHRPAIVG